MTLSRNTPSNQLTIQVIHNIVTVFRCQASPKKAETTRQDQLNQKSKQGDEGGRGRGRGKGRGRGRGRGRKSDESKASTKKEGKEDNHQPKRRRSKKDQAINSDWSAWGTDDAWSQGWYDDEWNQQEWSWDSVAYWESQNSIHQLEKTRNTETSKTTRGSGRQKSPKESKGTKDPKETKTSNKGKGGQEKKEPHTCKSKADDKKNNEAKGQQDVKQDGKKRKEKPGEQGTIKRSKAVGGTAEPVPTSTDERVSKILAFMNGFKDMDSEKATVLMRGRLTDVSTARLNIYYSRPAVGIHDRIEKRDIAYFKAAGENCPHVFLLAAAMKAGEMMATRWHSTCIFYICAHFNVAASAMLR